MRSRPFYVLACALAMTAMVLVVAGQIVASQVAMSGAHAADAQMAAERELWGAAAHQAAVQSGWMGLAALVVWGLGLGAWGCSLWRRERGLQSLPVLLLILAGALFFIMV
jgi:hypothetical protein